MLPVEFLGDSLSRLVAFPRDATRKAGQQLGKVQWGREPDDWKPMPSIGKGVREIRVWEQDGTFRVIYVVKSSKAVFVLHAFVKKSQATPKRDIELARRRFKEVR
jgi:phage-related protein